MPAPQGRDQGANSVSNFKSANQSLGKQMDRGAEQKALALAHRLCERQSKTGSWNAFVLRPGGSNLWTTAVSLCALGQLKKKLSAKPPRWIERGLKRGWQFMADQQSLGSAIGFNAETPHDADSTIWLCRSLITLGNHQTIENFDKQKNHKGRLARERVGVCY